MKPILTAFLGVVLCWTTTIHAQTHPRLFFDAADVAGYRAKAGTAPWSDMLAAIEWNLERDYTGGYDANRPFAQAMAALHLFRDSGAAPADYAEQAKLAVLWNISAPDSSNNTVWANNSYKALTRAGRALGVAIAFDICHSAWVGQTMPASFTAGNSVTYNVPAAYVGMDLNAGISLALKNNADSLVASGGSEWPGDGKYANNWYAVRYGSALLSYLACDEPESGWSANYNTCLAQLRNYFNASLTTRADANGWNPEGIAYAQYPGYFSFPAAFALRKLKGVDLTTEFPAMKKALWATYQGVLPIDRYVRTSAPGDTRIGWGKGLRPDFTDDHNAWDPEGTAALAFAFAPESYKPGLKWMFRRLCGDLGDQTWDCSTGNGLWTLLFYPDALAEQNPSTVWGNTYADHSYGVYMFRNRYQDENDFVMQTHGNARQNLGGHNGPDGLSFRIYGLGVPWCVGSGRTSDPRGQTNIFQYDPETMTSSGSPLVPTVLDTFLRANGDGYTVMNMDTTEIGVGNQTRRIITDYSGTSGAPGYFIVSDSSDDGSWWRMNTPDFNTITTGPDSFTITSPNGSKMTVKVLWPLNPVFRTGTFNRPPNFFYKDVNSAANSLPYSTKNKWVDFAGNGDGDFLVAITVTENGAPVPAISATGSGVAQTITAGTRVVTVNGNSIQVNGWTKPTLAISSPANGTNYNAGATTIPVSGTAGDPDGIQRVELWLDGVLLGNATLDGSGGWSGTLPNVPIGQHTFQAVAVDTVNDSASASITLKVNSTVPPDVAITWPSAATTLQSGQIVQLQGTASDPENALNRVEVWADGGKLGNATLAGGQWTYNWSGAKTGVHQVYVIAYDNAGDYTQTDTLPVTLSVRFSNIPKWGDAANYFVAGSFVRDQASLNGSARWSVVELDGDLRLKVRPVQNYDYDSHVAWLTGTDVTGKGNWRLSYKFKTGADLAANPESFVFFGAGTDAPMTLDLRPTNGVMPASHPNDESGTRVWHRLNSGPLVGVAWSLGAVTYPATPGTDYAGIPNAGWNDVRVDRVGKTLKVRVNDRLILDGDHALLGTKGPIGLGNWRPYGNGGSTGYFDDITLVALDAAGSPLAETPATGSIAEPATDGAAYAVGTAVTFSGSVTDPDTPAAVELFLGSKKIGDAVLTGAGTSRSWALAAPWTAVAGNYSLAIKTTDSLGNVAWPVARTFRVGSSANAAPSVTIGQNGAVAPPNFGLTGTVSDSDGSIAVVQVIRDGVPVGNATVTSGNWTYTFANLATGTYTMTARAYDNLGAYTEASAVLSHDGNGPPSISNIADQATAMNTPTSAIAFTVGDDTTAVGDLVVTAGSSNQTLLPNGNITLGGSGASRTITLTPATGQFGTSTITVTVADAAGKTASDTFLLTVPSGTPASISVTPATATVGLSGTRQFSASVLDSGGAAIIPQPTVTWSATGSGSINSSGLFTGAATPGTATVTATSGSVSGTASVTVSNTALTATIASPTVDSILLPDPGDSLALVVTFTNAQATPVVTWSQVSGPGTATFADPAAANTSVSFSATGSYVLRVSANDGQTSASDEITVGVGTTAGTGPVADVLGNDFQTVASSTVDSLNYSVNGAAASSLARQMTGNGSNTAAAAGFWNVPNSSMLAPSAQPRIQFSNNGITYVWGDAASGSSSLLAGGILTTFPDFSDSTFGPAWASGTTNRNLVVSSSPASATLPVNRAVNVLFDIKPGADPFSKWQVQADVGATTTGGAWYQMTAVQSGNLSATIYQVDPATGTLTVALSLGQKAIGATQGSAPVTMTLEAADQSAVLAPGTYLLQIAYIGYNYTQRPGMDNLRLRAAGRQSAAPQVNPGTAPAALPLQPATLNGTASDDGLPAGSSLVSTWSLVSGPGTATFANANSAATTVTFSAEGSYVLRLSATDGSATVFQNLNVIVGSTGGGYAAWIATQSGVGELTGENDDPDHDGIPNLVEYALQGGHPGEANTAILPVSSMTTEADQKYLTLTIQTNTEATGITLVGEVCGDLSTWQSGPTHTTRLSAEGANPLVIRDNTPLSGATRRFMRLKVVAE